MGMLSKSKIQKKAVYLIRNIFRHIDMVVVNAGWSLKSNLEDICLEDCQQLQDVNLLGALRTIYAIFNSLKKNLKKVSYYKCREKLFLF